MLNASSAATPVLLVRFTAINLVILGAWHLMLPSLWDWSAGMQSAPGILGWALDAINFDFSLLVIVTGAWLWLVSGRLADLPTESRFMFIAIILYWAAHGIYLLVRPFPLPPEWVSWRLLAQAFPWLIVGMLTLAAWWAGVFSRQTSLAESSESGSDNRQSVAQSRA